MGVDITHDAAACVTMRASSINTELASNGENSAASSGAEEVTVLVTGYGVRSSTLIVHHI